MPVLKPDQLNPAPEGCAICAYNVARFAKGQDPGVELHFHDCDEVWFMVEGKIKVQSEGEVYTLTPNEALLTKAGDEHALLEVLEDSVIVWCEFNLRGQKRLGHLHKPEDG